MPMSAQIRSILRNDDDVADALLDRLLAEGTDVDLRCLIWLDGVYDLGAERHPSNAHATTPAVMTANTTTRAMSNALLSWSRNGLSPMEGR